MGASSPERAERIAQSLMIDTHCHLDGDVYADDLGRVIEESRSLGVTRWINVGFEPGRWRSTVALANDVQGMSHMLGLHPGHAHEWSNDLRTDLESLLILTKPVAIGEIGLDFFRGETNGFAQQTAFEGQLDLAVGLHLPAVIHMRAAENEVLSLLQNRQTLPHLVFHSFEGSMRLRDFVVEHGSMVGFGGLATRASATDLRQVIGTIPLEQIMLETDSPYLVPKGVRGRRNVPANMVIIADVLADLAGKTPAEIADTTTRNVEQTFDLVGRQ